jgi:hypothetical protein
LLHLIVLPIAAPHRLANCCTSGMSEPAGAIFAVCFFVMLFCLAIDSQFAMCEVTLTFLKVPLVPRFD